MSMISGDGLGSQPIELVYEVRVRFDWPTGDMAPGQSADLMRQLQQRAESRIQRGPRRRPSDDPQISWDYQLVDWDPDAPGRVVLDPDQVEVRDGAGNVKAVLDFNEDGEDGVAFEGFAAIELPSGIPKGARLEVLHEASRETCDFLSRQEWAPYFGTVEVATNPVLADD